MKKIFKIIFFTLLVLMIFFGIKTYPKLSLISGFSAKSIASAHFIDGRSLSLIEKTDNDIELISLSKNKINDSQKYVFSSVFGLKKRKAIFREGLGATLINDDFDESKSYEIPKRFFLNNNLAFPYGNTEPKDTVFKNIDYDKLNASLDNLFDKKNEKKYRLRSLLVVYKDKIIAEKYTQNFNKNSKILGWSMTKSITATIFGILRYQRKIKTENSTQISEWQKDNRKNITINDLLHMNSGLEWNEDYGSISDATTMLFQAENMGEAQLMKQVKYKPNTHWKYSSGTTNLLSYILRKKFKTHQQYLDFWYSALIDKIGMNSMIIETDMAGNYVGSSYGWATTRDWAKFGLLYLHNGNWNGNQIFDKNWSKFVTTPTPTSNGQYGAHFWLNAGGYYKNAPSDLYSCNGFQGQRIFILPSQDLVIVKFGLKDDSNGDNNTLIKEVLECIKEN